MRSLSIKSVCLIVVTAAVAIATTAAQAGKLQVIYSFCADKDPNTGICHDGELINGPVVRDSQGRLFGTASRGGQFDQGTVFELTGSALSTIYSFCKRTNCTDGAVPLGGVVIDKSDDIFGTTQNGGPASSGVVFELKHGANGFKYTVLHEFCSRKNCADGGDAVAGLVMDDAGNLFGTTLQGGLGASQANSGTVYEVSRDMTTGKWTETVLYAFCSLTNCTDGEFPNGGVMVDSKGNIYGTTSGGGQVGGGTVFKLSQNPKTKKWKEDVLYNFCSQQNCADGSFPVAPPTMDKSGNLYGTAQSSGAGNPGSGVVYKLTLKGGKYTFGVLYTFCQSGSSDCEDGDHPQAGVILDKSGNIYGTTSSTLSNDTQYSNGGTVFRLTPAGKETLLVRFCQSVCEKSGKSNGLTPTAALIMDSAGNLYGTTDAGGHNGDGGEVFEVPK